MKLEEAIEQVLKKSERDNLSSKTIYNYNWAYAKILDEYNLTCGGVPIEEITLEQANKILNKLNKGIVDGTDEEYKKEKGFYPGYTSYKYIQSRFKALFRFIHRPEIFNWIGSSTLEQPDIDPLTIDEIQGLIQSTDKKIGCIISTLYCTGLRASELLSLKIGDIDFETKTGKVLGKGRKRKKDGFWFLFDGCERLKEYLEEEGRFEDKSKFLFYRDYPAKPYDYWWLWWDLKQATGYNPHLFRHSIGYWMLRNDYSVDEVRKFLRHKDIGVTSRYLSIGEDQLTKKIDKQKVKLL